MIHDDFQYRVNMAASYISQGRSTSRSFDGCFENYDGDAVVVALYRRAQNKPDGKLARNIWRYLAKDSVTEMAAKYADLSRVELVVLADSMRVDARREFETFMAQQGYA